MIAPHRVTCEFKQKADSCVLASYGLALRAKSTIPAVDEVFEAYCAHFGITSQLLASFEHAYAADFPSRWGNGKPSGFRVVRDLHASSEAPTFVAARQAAKVLYVPNVAVHTVLLESVLRDEDALLCVAIREGAHAVVVGWDGTVPFLVDPQDATGYQPGQTLTGLPNPDDGLLVLF